MVLRQLLNNGWSARDDSMTSYPQLGARKWRQKKGDDGRERFTYTPHPAGESGVHSPPPAGGPSAFTIMT
jgi:hypothetical protein